MPPTPSDACHADESGKTHTFKRSLSITVKLCSTHSSRARYYWLTAKPLTGGSVQFIPKQGGLPAVGIIGEDGTFSLNSKTREGAAPGEYKVRIEPSSELLRKKGRAAQKLPFASNYREFDGNTGLTATIRAEATQLEPFPAGLISAALEHPGH